MPSACPRLRRIALMSTTLFLEAFGRLSGPATIDSREEDLYSVFRERAELMRWATTSNDRPLLWSMEEAEITADTDLHRIGWVQVGLDVRNFEPARPPLGPVQGWAYAPLTVHRSAIEPALVLPALVQCLDDALRRFGVVELSGFQVTASSKDADTQSCLGYLVSVLNWFNTNMKAGVEAIVAFDRDLLDGDKVSELVAILQRRNTHPFEFSTFTPVSENTWSAYRSRQGPITLSLHNRMPACSSPCRSGRRAQRAGCSPACWMRLNSSSECKQLRNATDTISRLEPVLRLPPVGESGRTP